MMSSVPRWHDRQAGLQRHLTELRLALGGGLIGVSVVRILSAFEPSSSLTLDAIGAIVGTVLAWIVVHRLGVD
jgi:presenilin-like A22 family membrane protease